MVEQFIEFFGRLHPAVLHFPIGILSLAFLFDVLFKYRDARGLKEAADLSLLLGAVSAVATALFGYFLSLEEGYGGDLLDLHKWMGIVVAVLAVALYVIRRRAQVIEKEDLPQYYMALWAVTMLLLVGAGHFGGSLTHGESFVTEKVPDPFRGIMGLEPRLSGEHAELDLDSAQVFQEIIQPVLDANCVSCHNPGKTKGGLLLTTHENILTGGESGKTLVVGAAMDSELYKRLLLPKDDEKHMPPPGKKPLTDDQKRLIAWWIDSGAPSEERLANVEIPEDVNEILIAMAEPANPLLKLDIDPVADSDLAELRASGIAVHPVSLDMPFLDVNLSDRKSLPREMLQKLETISDQVVALDLGGSAIRNADLDIIRELPHLQRLVLNHTAVGDSALEFMQELEYLEFLNLVKTDVTDAGLTKLASLKRLKKLYLWETTVSEEAIAELSSALPELQPDVGFDLNTLFGKSQLKPPVLDYETSIFAEKVDIDVKLNISGVKAYYTLNGEDPDSTSTPVDGPIQINETTTLKLICYKDGWAPSEVLENLFVKRRYDIKNIKLAKPPAEKYDGLGPETLINLQKGDIAYASDFWLGYEAEDLKATLDLGKSSEVKNVVVSALADNGSWIFYPVGIRVEASNDGRNFKQIANKNIPVPEGGNPPSLKYFSAPFTPQNARYLRVTVKNITYNPEWHSNPGGKSWVFVDEILVE